MKLEGIRVIDLSLFLPGPLMTQFMADHGAEVIKVESIHEGEPNREIGPKRDGVSVYFANTHRGKKSLGEAQRAGPDPEHVVVDQVVVLAGRLVDAVDIGRPNEVPFGHR